MFFRDWQSYQVSGLVARQATHTLSAMSETPGNFSKASLGFSHMPDWMKASLSNNQNILTLHGFLLMGQ